MDSSIVAAFSQAAKDTFKDMFGLDVVESGSRELDASKNHGWDLTGLLGLAGQAQGVIAIRLSSLSPWACWRTPEWLPAATRSAGDSKAASSAR